LPKQINPENVKREASVPSLEVDTTPAPYPASTYDFIMQAIWEINRNIGSIQTSVQTLTNQGKDHSDKLSAISHKVYAAEVLIGVLASAAGVAGFLIWHLLSHIWNTLAPLVKVSIQR